MTLSIEIRADILKTLMTEDRMEIRGIHSSIYNVTTLLGTTSFAISAFLLGREISHGALLGAMTDGLLILLLWVYFLRLIGDLYGCRQCLVARQDLIKKLVRAGESDPFDPFPDASGQKTDLRDSGLWWLPNLTTALVAAKALIIWLQFS